MKKWDKSYTYAIVTVVVFAALFAGAHALDNRNFKFDGSDKVREQLEDWDPYEAETKESQISDGEILFYSISHLDQFGGFTIYREDKDPKCRFLNSDIESASDIGVIAVLYYDRDKTDSYTNGAAAFRVKCTIYILDPDTLDILATDSVSGPAPASTTSGGDRYGSFPSIADCRNKAEELVEEMKD